MCASITLAFVLSAWWIVGVDIPNGPFAMVFSGSLATGFGDVAPYYVFAERHSLGLSFLVNDPRKYYLLVPLPFCLGLVAVPIVAVWWAIPKHPHGSCKCGYYYAEQ